MASSGDDDRVAFLYPEKGKNVNWVDGYMEYTELQVKKDLQQQFRGGHTDFSYEGSVCPS